jgi:hypothetical protein
MAEVINVCDYGTFFLTYGDSALSFSVGHVHPNFFFTRTVTFYADSEIYK